MWVQVWVWSHVVTLVRGCIVVDQQCRGSKGKVKIEGYMNISDEEAHHHQVGQRKSHQLSKFPYMCCWLDQKWLQIRWQPSWTWIPWTVWNQVVDMVDIPATRMAQKAAWLWLDSSHRHYMAQTDESRCQWLFLNPLHPHLVDCAHGVTNTLQWRKEGFFGCLFCLFANYQLCSWKCSKRHRAHS